MKTTQGRNLLVTVVLLVVLLVLGLATQHLIRTYLTETTFARLDDNTREVVDLAEKYHVSDTSSTTGLLMNVKFLSSASRIDVILCDSRGRITAFSGSDDTTVSLDPKTIPQKIRKEIAVANECIHYQGKLGGVYAQRSYVSALPVKTDDGVVVAYVLSSVSASGIASAIEKISDIFLFGAAGLMIVCVVAFGFFSKRQTQPLKEMAQKARAFGHGDLDSRVQISGTESREVEELAIAFNNMASSLQKSEYSRQEFVANVSHELKTPMTTISGYIDGILDGTIPEEKSRYYMQIVSSETKRLSRLVRSMLDISQLQSEGGIPSDRMTRFDVEECAGQMLITFEQKITDKQLQVEVDMPDCPIYTVAQQDYISQVIYNLLDNAVKFCPQGGRLCLKIRESGSKIYVSVGNDGKTIPPDELPLIFERFHKTDKSRAENRDGWGLGLYIVKTIIGLHGEDISAASMDGFTEFTFTLPLMS